MRRSCGVAWWGLYVIAGALGARGAGTFPFSKEQEGMCESPLPLPAPMGPPPARTAAEEEHRRAVDGALARHWEGRRGYGIARAEEAAITDASVLPSDNASILGCRAGTYGEATSVGMRQVGRAMGCDALDAGRGYVFMDFGSGVGKFVARAFLEWPSVVRAAGVELSGSRSAHARAAWGAAIASGTVHSLRSAARSLLGGADAAPPDPFPADAVSFVEGDMLLQDIGGVTHLYTSSLCFPDGMLHRLSEKLAAEGERLEVVATLRRFPRGIRGFRPPDKIEAQMSWTRRTGGAAVHLYRRAGLHPGT